MKRVIASREGVGITASVIQKQELYLSQVFNELPTIVFVKEGTKTLRRGSSELEIREGEAVAIAGGQSFDVINRPNGKDFEAAWIAFPSAIVQNFSFTRMEDSVIETAFPIRELKSGFREAFQTARDTITTSKQIPDHIAIHRVGEVLLWLGEFGKRFPVPSSQKLSHRIRSLLNANPSEDWSAGGVANRLEISEATLRRKLSSEKISFTELLIDVRMSYALSLLQSTELSIGEIAKEVGYESPSRFAVRFRDRFGHSPTVLRKETVQFKRNGTVPERVGI